MSVCLCACPTDLKFSTHIKDHHILDEFEGQGHRPKVKVTKVKNVKISVLTLVSEKVVQVEGQGCKVNFKGRQNQGQRW